MKNFPGGKESIKDEEKLPENEWKYFEKTYYIKQSQ